MQIDKPSFCANADRPRPPQQEIADLLAMAILRLRAEDSACDYSTTPDVKDEVDLGFSTHQRVNTNLYQEERVHA
jgi:hypothetical protein